MFKLFKRVDLLEIVEDYQDIEIKLLVTKLQSLENYLDIEFFHGNKCKPHYRKKRVIIKKLGRPLNIK